MCDVFRYYCLLQDATTRVSRFSFNSRQNNNHFGSRLWKRFIGKSCNRRPICHVLFLHKLRHSLHDFVSRISRYASEKAIVFSIGTIVLNPPFSSPHLLSPSSAITRFLLATKFRNGNSRRYNYLRYLLTSPPALTCFEELKFYWNRLRLSYISEKSTRGKQFSHLWMYIKSRTLLFHHNLYEFMSLVSHLTKLILAGSLYLNVLPQHPWFLLLPLYCITTRWLLPA